MIRIMRRMFFLLALLLFIPLGASAASLDDYYLARFNALYGNKARVALASPAPKGVDERCLTPLYHGLKRDWKKLSSETQKTLAKYLSKPTLSGAEAVPFTSSQGHFKIHYTISGSDAPKPVNGQSVLGWVKTVADAFENVYQYETGTMGYNPAPALSGAPYDVYLQELSETKKFGYTESDTLTSNPYPNSFTSFIVIDNDFANSDVYGVYTGMNGLEITASHEYHHAIQYGYNYHFDIWYAEATSTWIEDEVYDSVNQLYTYLPFYMQNSTLSLDTPVSTTTGGGYGRWIFNRYIAERYGGPGIIKSVWEEMRYISPSNGDIPMLPVIDTVLQGKGGGLGSDFFSFTKNLYLRNWTTHDNEISNIQIVPAASYSTYPVTKSASPAPSVTLPHDSFVYYKFSPSATAPQTLFITLSKGDGISITATAFKKTTGGNITEYQLDPATETITIAGFNAPDTAEVALLISNNSGQDGQTINFTTSDTPPPQSLNSGGGSGGGGCFIATAAYGSYLHPKVIILREFRDKRLLTNAPGRVLVTLYYRISPSLADILSRHEALRFICRIFLAPIVLAVEYPHFTALLLLVLFFPLIGTFLISRLMPKKCLKRNGM